MGVDLVLGPLLGNRVTAGPPIPNALLRIKIGCRLHFQEQSSQRKQSCICKWFRSQGLKRTSCKTFRPHKECVMRVRPGGGAQQATKKSWPTNSAAHGKAPFSPPGLPKYCCADAAP